MKNALALVFALIVSGFALCEGPFETSVIVTEIEATFAKAASVESMPDRVAVFLVEPLGLSQKGIELSITTKAKATIVEARLVFGRSVPVYRRENGNYYFFGPPGEYEIGVYQFADDTAYKTLIPEVFIGPRAPPVDPPPVDPPIPGRLEGLKTIASENLRVLKDPEVSKALGQAYADTLKASEGKTREELAAALREARAAVMRSRAKLSRAVAWNTFIESCDAEIKRVAESLETFKLAVGVLSEILLKG